MRHWIFLKSSLNTTCVLREHIVIRKYRHSVFSHEEMKAGQYDWTKSKKSIHNRMVQNWENLFCHGACIWKCPKLISFLFSIQSRTIIYIYRTWHFVLWDFSYFLNTFSSCFIHGNSKITSISVYISKHWGFFCNKNMRNVS